MPQLQSPWLEGAYGWNFGEGGWNSGMDSNLLKFSFMFDRNVDSVVASLPAAVNGQAHYLTTDNRLYFAVGATYFSTVVPKWFEFKDRSTGNTYQFNGVSAVQIDSPAQIDSRVDAVEITVASLGTAAFENIEFFATQAELDVVAAPLQQFDGDLQNNSDLTLGANLVHRTTQTVSDVVSLRLVPGRYDKDSIRVVGYYSTTPNVGGGIFYWDSTSTSTDDSGLTIQVTGLPTGRWIREFNGSAEATWFGAVGDGITDDTIALQKLHSDYRIKEVIYPAKTFAISAPIEVINNGQKIKGVNGLRFNSEKSKILALTPSTVAFQQTLSAGSGQEDAFSMYDMEIHSDFGIQLNPMNEQVIDGGGATFPYLMRPEFRRLTLHPLTPGIGTGLAMSKCFDHIIEQCEFYNFARGIVMNGCDLGRVSTNRISLIYEYGILDLSAATFGSQNLITNNDMVRCQVATATFIRSTARHVRIIDNYLEQPVASCKGFIDLSGEVGLNYPNNTSSGQFGTVEVERNRLDGHAFATDFIYKYDPTAFLSFGYSVNIEDTGTNGTSSTLPWLTVTGATLPVRVGAQGYKKYRLKGGYNTSNVNRFTSFETSSVDVTSGKVSVTSENLVNMMRSELNRNNATDHVGLSDAGFVIKTTLGTALLHVVLPAVGGVNNPWLRDAASIPVTIVARCVTGTQNLNTLKVVNAAAQGATLSTNLDTQWQTINMTFTGVVSTSTVGIALSFGATQASDIVIRSITFG